LATLADMALFVEVARARSFRLAAIRLDMPVSTLSRRIAALERRLGVALLLRATRSVCLAESARAYYERCVQVIEAAADARSALTEGARHAQKLRVSMPVDLGVYILGPIIAAYAARFPGLTVEFDLSAMARDPFRDPVDVMFRVGRPLDERVVARKVATIHGGLYAAPAYLSRGRVIGAPDDLAGAACLNLKMSHGFMPWSVGGRRWQQAPGPAPFSANSVALLRALAERGHGVALLPTHVGEPGVRARTLARVLPDEKVGGWPLFALTATRSLPGVTRELLAEVRRALRAEGAGAGFEVPES
jgi:DNA-binding transcriptional LysR family regulator